MYLPSCLVRLCFPIVIHIARYFASGLGVCALCFGCFSVVAEEADPKHKIATSRPADIALAQAIRQRFEHRWLELSPKRANHMGLRLGRLYRDPRYRYTWLSDIRYMAQGLTDFHRIGLSNSQLQSHYSALTLKPLSLQSPVVADDKRVLRHVMSVKYPVWRQVFAKIVYYLASLEGYQLRHQHHKDFVDFLQAFPFEDLLNDPNMMKAWGIQLANQVYWLYQVTGHDLRAVFIEQFRSLYPDKKDSRLSEQQYWNKLYTMTHLIIADSAYYQRVVDANEWAWVLSYFRDHWDEILRRGKADIIAEIGLCFLLAGLEKDPTVTSIRQVIAQSVDPSEKMIPTHDTGSFDLSEGEHRNILAIMLLDWQAPDYFPLREHMRALVNHLPDHLRLQKNR